MSSRENPNQPEDVSADFFVPMDGLQFSTVDFYRTIEEELEARRMPRLYSRRVEFREGGLLSDKRLYLRLMRERFAFEVCAAPFGTGYFFSVRFGQVPRGGWIMLFLLLVATGLTLSAIGTVLMYITFYVAFQATGTFWLLLGLVDAAAIVALVDHRTRHPVPPPPPTTGIVPFRKWEMPDFDTFILGLPVIGEWYERRRKETYYRHDTRRMYQHIVFDVVKKRVEELIAAKGFKLIRPGNHKDILTDFYKVEPEMPDRDHANPPPHAVN